jgi:hypothetical protein
MPLTYWHPSDESPNLIGNLKVSDDSDGWWSGVQLNFVSVAIALTLAAGANAQTASRVANQPQDELVFQQVFDDTFWNAPPSVIPAPVPPQPWTFEASDIVPQPVIAALDDGFWQSLVFTAIPATSPQPWEFRQDELVFLPVFEDDSGWPKPLILISPPSVLQPWSFEQSEVLASQTTFVPWIAEDDA